MCKKMLLYKKLISLAFRSEMQHRASFFMLFLAQIISSITEFFGIWILFDRFKTIQGWTLPELALLYGLINMGFSFAEALGRGFEKFSLLIKYGGFDRLLLRPIGTLFQVATSQACAVKMGRFVLGFFVLVWSFSKLNFCFFSLQTLCLICSFLGTTCLFYGLFVIQATFAFWLTETLEIFHTATYGGREVSQYPITIFNKGFFIFFVYIVPIACVLYFPVAIILQKALYPLWLAFLAPFTGLLFLFASFQIWKLGVAYYRSTGS